MICWLATKKKSIGKEGSIAFQTVQSQATQQVVTPRTDGAGHRHYAQNS
jgi:hypothetical protein